MSIKQKNSESIKTARDNLLPWPNKYVEKEKMIKAMNIDWVKLRSSMTATNPYPRYKPIRAKIKINIRTSIKMSAQ